MLLKKNRRSPLDTHKAPSRRFVKRSGRADLVVVAATCPQRPPQGAEGCRLLRTVLTEDASLAYMHEVSAPGDQRRGGVGREARKGSFKTRAVLKRKLHTEMPPLSNHGFSRPTSGHPSPIACSGRCRAQGGRSKLLELSFCAILLLGPKILLRGDHGELRP